MRIRPSESFPTLVQPLPDLAGSFPWRDFLRRGRQRVLRSQYFPAAIVGLLFISLLALWDGSRSDTKLDAGGSSDGSVAELLRSDKARFYTSQTATALPTAVQIKRFSEALRTLKAHGLHSDAQLLARANGMLRSVNYELAESTDGYWYIRDRLLQRGWGSYVLNRAPRDRLLVEIPRPIDEVNAMEAGLALFYETGARALAIAGSKAAAQQGRDVLTSSATFYHAFHRIVADQDVLAVRSAAIGTAENSGWTPSGVSRLWVNNDLPTSLGMQTLKELIGTLVVIRKASPLEILQRRTTPRGYVELYLNGDDASRLVAQLEGRAVMYARWQSDAVKQQLHKWMLADAATSVDGHVVASPSASQQLFFEREVLGPLFRIATVGNKRGKWSAGTLAQLRAIHYVAAGMDYGVTRVRDAKGKQEYLVLHGTTASPQDRSRYVFRVGGGDDYAVNVPDATQEPNALEYGLTLFDSLKARAMLIAGATGKIDRDSDEGALKNAGENALSLASRVIKKELGDHAFMVVISRGLTPIAVPKPRADVSLALADGTMSSGDATPLARHLISIVQRTGLSYRLVGSDKYATVVQADAAQNEIATLWLSRSASVAHQAPRRLPVVAKRAPDQTQTGTLGDANEATHSERFTNTRTAFLALDDSE